MNEPPSKRARISESPPRDRTGSPSDRYSIHGSSTTIRSRPSVLASPGAISARTTFSGQGGSPLASSRIPSQSHLVLPQPTSSLHPSSTRRRSGSQAGSPRMPLPSVAHMSGGHWHPSTPQYEAGPSSSRIPHEPSTAPLTSLRKDNLSGINEEKEASDTGTVGTTGSRDQGRERAPRSMMACVRCRKQKMKCDGPAAAPCRGCVSVGITCVFETRTRSSRPKSMSVLAPPQPLPAVMSSATATNQAVQYGHGQQQHHHHHHHHQRNSLEYQSGQGVLAGTSTPLRHGMPPPPPTTIAADTRNLETSHVHAVPDAPMTYAHYATPTYHGHRQSYSTSTPIIEPRRRSSVVGQVAASSGGIVSPGVAPRSPIMSSSIAAAASAQEMHSLENRLRFVENSLRNIEVLQNSHHSLSETVQRLEIQVRHLTGQVNDLTQAGLSRSEQQPPRRSSRGREERTIVISEQVWDAYRSYCCPLTPWLVVLTSPTDFSGEVISTLGTRPSSSGAAGPGHASGARHHHHHQQHHHHVGGELGNGASAELGKLIAEGEEWTRDDIHALGTFATWEGNSNLANLAIGQARAASGRQRAYLQGSMREARDQIEWVVLEHMLWSINGPNYVPSSVKSTLSAGWRERVRTYTPAVPSDKDHDVKMLAWLEYAELLTEVQNGLLDPVGDTKAGTEARHSPGVAAGERLSSDESSVLERVRSETLDKRKDYLAEWEAWNSRWGRAGDPILVLHYHYAILLTTSPLLMPRLSTISRLSPSKTAQSQPSPPGSSFGRNTATAVGGGGSGSVVGTLTAAAATSEARMSAVWQDLTTDHSGYEMLTKAKEAAVGLIRSICSPEIARTLHYSFPLFRTRLAFAIAHLLAHTIALPHSTTTALPLHQSTLRLVYESLGGNGADGRPSSGWTALGEGSILVEVVRTGQVSSPATRGLFMDVSDGTTEVGRELWDKVLGR